MGLAAGSFTASLEVGRDGQSAALRSLRPQHSLWAVQRPISCRSLQLWVSACYPTCTVEPISPSFTPHAHAVSSFGYCARSIHPFWSNQVSSSSWDPCSGPGRGILFLLTSSGNVLPEVSDWHICFSFWCWAVNRWRTSPDMGPDRNYQYAKCMFAKAP